MKLLQAAALFGLLLLSNTAHAADSPVERAKDAFKAGAAAYAAGDYAAAVQALETAYALTPLPAIAFSLAQATRKQYFATHDGAQLLRSIELFERYLSEVPSGGRRADALEAAAQLEPLAAGFRKPNAPRGDNRGETRVMITAEAAGAMVALDGAPAVPAPLIREVAPGPHRAAVTAPGYYPENRIVTALKGELMLKELTLRERPSTLLLSTPDESDVYIDGSYASPGGAELRLQLSSGVHRLAVSKNGFKLRQETVELGRGETARLRVVLEATTQRTVSQGLFMGGGLLLGGSLVLNAFRIRAENRAESFLREQSSHNVSANELVRYSATVAERDRYGTASAAALAGAAGAFLAGLFLHELDQPDLERLRGADTWPRERTPVRLGLSAWSAEGALGGTLYGKF